MKLLAVAALLTLSVSALGCKAPGDAFAGDVCACKDKACIDKSMKDHETKFPEATAKLGEMDKMPEDKKKQLGRAVECMRKVSIEEEKAKKK